MSKVDKFMGMPLGVEGTDSASSDEGESEEEKEQPEKVLEPKRKKVEVSVEDLERAGYRAGPSVLFMREKVEQEPSDWNWSNGRAAKDNEGGEDEEDRAATREAVNRGLSESAQHSLKAMENAARLREDARQEKERLAQEKRLSFNQKEKRKRDTGQTSRAKSTVEESKRQAREFGVYSGFD